MGAAIILVKEHYHKYAPQLLGSYQKKLLQPGWAGELTPDELDHIRSCLRQSPSLKRRWGFRPSAKRLSESRIRAVARNGLSAIGRRVLASVVNKHLVIPMFFP